MAPYSQFTEHYIGTVAKRKKLMPPVDTVTGGAVRLFDAGDTLGVSEGIETAIATMELLGVPTWAALTAGRSGGLCFARGHSPAVDFCR